MALLTKNVVVKISSKNHKHYKKLGYDIRVNDLITIPTHHLTTGSHVKVEVLCDYCNTNIVSKNYNTYLNQNKDGDCCKKCWKDKLKIVVENKYSVSNVSSLNDIKLKKQETSMINYGVDNPTQSQIVLNKMKETMMNKYGYDNAAKVPEFSLKNQIARMKTLFDRNNIMKSKQQEYLHELFGGILNYVVGTCAIDIAFPDLKLAIEYDGSGHDIPVKRNKITKQEFDNKERKRNYFLINKNWRIVRIVSRHDKLPKNSFLLEMMNFAKRYLIDENHHMLIFDLDNNKIIKSNEEYKYNYGELKKVI